MLKNVEKKKKREMERERARLDLNVPSSEQRGSPLRSKMSKSGREREGALGEGGGSHIIHM